MDPSRQVSSPESQYANQIDHTCLWREGHRPVRDAHCGRSEVEAERPRKIVPTLSSVPGKLPEVHKYVPEWKGRKYSQHVNCSRRFQGLTHARGKSLSDAECPRKRRLGSARQSHGPLLGRNVASLKTLLLWLRMTKETRKQIEQL